MKEKKKKEVRRNRMKEGLLVSYKLAKEKWLLADLLLIPGRGTGKVQGR